jgi:Holliday junction resolvasome RuvABC DNA-binding subunit
MTAFEPTEASVQTLVSMGFVKKEVIEALRCVQGDEQKAMDLLLENSLQEPSHERKRRKRTPQKCKAKN